MMKTSKPVVVLDTNVLLVSLPPRSQFRPIFDRLLDGDYELVITNDILTEYEEIIARRYDEQTINELFELFSVLPNVKRTTPYFKWNLIINDPDDNKFADAAISAGVNFLVTNDKHFNVLKKMDFPPVPVCRAEDFMSVLADMPHRF